MLINVISRSECLKGMQTFPEKKGLKLEFQKPERLFLQFDDKLYLFTFS